MILFLNLPEFLRTEKRGKQERRVWCLSECCFLRWRQNFSKVFSDTGEHDNVVLNFLSHLTYDWVFVGMKTFSFQK